LGYQYKFCDDNATSLHTVRLQCNRSQCLLIYIERVAVVSWTSVVAACLYGNSPEFLAVLEREVDPVSMVTMPSDTRAWLQGR
jgi:hypothetical protein